MNKKRRAERGHRTVKGGAAEDKDAEARRINVQPWDPPPGMIKRQCPECRYFFAAPEGVAPPDCMALGTRPTAASVG
jgi:hypothetical protein